MEPSDSPAAAAAAADRRWLILNHWGIDKDSSVNVVADDKTVAEFGTSSGRPFRISLAAAAPPAISFIRADPAADDKVYVIAAHGDSVLFRRKRVPQSSLSQQHLDDDSYQPSYDYFVYKAAAGEPPSLSLLPTCCFPIIQRDYQGYIYHDEFYTARELDQGDTGILRRGKNGELIVAQLRVALAAPFDTAELCVLRPGRIEWELKTAVPIVHHDGGRGHDLRMWQDTHMAVPVGDRFLCWVNFDCSTFLVCDMAAEDEDDPKLRYVPLPVKPMPPKDDEDYDDCYVEQPRWLYYRSIGAVGPQAVRFVSIDNRCCCGAHVAWSSCEHSSSAFMVTMWTLELRTGEPMTWVKEAVLDCEELWSLAACKGLPRLELTCPVVSLENPDVVCFVACEEKLLWTVEIDVRRKTLISATPCPAHPQRCVNYVNHLPAKLHYPK